MNGSLLPREGLSRIVKLADESPYINDNDSPLTARKIFTDPTDDEYVFYIVDGGGYSSRIVDGVVSSTSSLGASGVNANLRVDVARGVDKIVLSNDTATYVMEASSSWAITEFFKNGGMDSFPTRSCCYIDGRWVYVGSDQDALVWYSDVNTPSTVSELSFFDAESRTDKSLECFTIGNDLFIAGQRSIERFRSTGIADNPFIRVGNSVLDVGYVGGLTRLEDRAIFIGRRNGGGNAIYEMSGNGLRQISNSWINEFLNSTELNTEVEREQATSFSFNSYGYDCYVFTVNGTSMVAYPSTDPNTFNWSFISDNVGDIESRFDKWHLMPMDENPTVPGIFSSGKEEALRARAFSFVDAAYVNGHWIFLRGFSGSECGIFKKNNLFYDESEAVEPISRGVRFNFSDQDQKDFTIHNIEVTFTNNANRRQSGGSASDEANLYVTETGVSWGYDYTSSLDYSVADGKEWRSPVSVPFGNLDNLGRLRFNKLGGLGKNNGYVGFVLETSSNQSFTIDKVLINV